MTKELNPATELTNLIQANSLEAVTAESLKAAFEPFFQKVSEWKEKANSLIVTSVDQKAEMKEAREGRLALKEIRVTAEKTRKALKEDSLKKGKVIDAAYSLIENQIKPLEAHLELQEKFAEIQEAKRLAEVKAARLELLRPYTVAIDANLIGMMSDDMFDNFLNGTKRKHEEAIEAERLAEVARLEALEAIKAERLAQIEAERLAQIERERIEAEQREAMRIENERLKAEAAIQEAQMKAQREKAEAERKAFEESVRLEREKAEAERKERERLEANRLAAERAEKERLEKIERERLEAERKAKSAPDKEKILAYVKMITELEMPLLDNEDTAQKLSYLRSEFLGKALAKFNELAREL